MERSIDHVHLLFARQSHEVNCVTGHADGKTWVFLRVVHRIYKHFAIQDVYVHVVTRSAEKRVQNTCQIRDAFFTRVAEAFRHQGRGE